MNTSIYCLVATAALSAIATSCTDDKFETHTASGNAITFKTENCINVTKSRSGSNRTFIGVSSAKTINSDKWLIAAEREGIDINALGNKGAEATNAVVSRAATVTTDNFYDSFAVYGYTHATGTTFADAHASAETYINGALAAKESATSSVWTTNPQYNWTTSKYDITFFGIAPASISGYDGYKIASAPANPTISYTVRDNAADQPDVILAEKTCPGNGSGVDNVLMEFNHLLTAVKVKVNITSANDEAFAKSVKTLTFRHVRNVGTYSIIDKKWTVENAYKDYTLTVPADGKTVDGEFALADGENTFMMMPQSFTDNDDAMLIATLNDGSTVAGSLKDAGKMWTKGNSLTYYISDDRDLYKYVLDVPTSTIYFSWDKDEKKCPVTSYKVTYNAAGDSTITYLNWQSSYKEEDSNNFKFVEKISNQLIDNHVTADSVIINTSRIDDSMVSETESADVNAVKSASLKGGLGTDGNTYYYDLSTNSTGSSATNRNTANCYIVNSPGYYKIPLVYGNSIKNGNREPSGTYSFSSGSNILTTFKEHRGYDIPDPWITYWYYNYYNEKRGNGYIPTKVGVLWQDVKGLISGLRCTTDQTNGDYIYFYIAQTNIQPGNAVLVLYDDYDVPMWTWHIWVTPYSLGNGDITVENAGNGTSSFMQYPLGYVKEPTRTYKERHATLVLEQVENGIVKQTKEVALVQEKHSYSPVSAPYYQFGRMVPFPGAICSEAGGLDKWSSYQYTMEDKVCYDGNGNVYNISKVSGRANDIAAALKDPGSFYVTDGASWLNNNSQMGCNLWGCASNGDKNSSYKTVYDPCPVGYKVPPLNAFPQLTYDNLAHSSKADQFSVTVSDETDLFTNIWNTPFTSHTDFIDYFGFKFYTHRMNGYGNKPSNKETILFPALGYRIACQAEVTASATVGQTRTVGGPHNMGGYFYYWSSSQRIDTEYNTETYFIQGDYLLGNCSMTPSSHTKWAARGLPIWPVKG